MTNQDNGSWAVILILILVFLLPIGWMLVFYAAEPYHAVSGEPLRDAAQAAGITMKTGIFTPFRASLLIVPRPGMLPSRFITHNRLGGAGLSGNFSLSETT